MNSQVHSISLASHIISRLASFTYQPISAIIITLIIHYSLTLSLQAQNLPFQQILPMHLNTYFSYRWTTITNHDHGTEPDLSCFSIYF